MSSDAHFTIGALASRAGLTPDALRYYERLGVIPKVPRSAAGHRVYSADMLARLQFITQAQRHGLTLAEIRELLRLDTSRGTSQCRRVQQLLERKLADVDARVAELQAFRRTLGGYVEQCGRALTRGADPACPVIEDLQGTTK